MASRIDCAGPSSAPGSTQMSMSERLFCVSTNVVNVTGFRTFRQVAWGGSFEGSTTLGLGVRARLPFRVTVLDGADLLIDHVPGRARCAPCGAEWATGMPPQLCCPQCEGGRAELVQGRELQIVGLRHTGSDTADGAARPAPVQVKES